MLRGSVASRGRLEGGFPCARSAGPLCSPSPLVLVLPAGALAWGGGVEAGQPFPTNLYTVRDRTQATGLRVDLPTPDCVVRPNDCADVAVLDTLDGFNIQPRISIPFDGPIDVSTVTKKTVFLVGPRGRVIGPNQLVWEPAANTLHFESDRQLKEATTYLLVVTRGVRGTDGKPLARADFGHGKGYADDLRRALPMAMFGGANKHEIAAASLFTTQSIRAISRKIRRQLRGGEATFTARHERRAHGLPAVDRERDHLAAADHHDADVLHGRAGAAAPGRSRNGRLRLVRLARLRDAREGDPAGRDEDRQAGRAGHEPGAVLRLPARGHPAVRRLAGRDLRARLHRLEERRATGGGRHVRAERHRDGRDQRRRSRRRLARDVHSRARRPRAGHPAARRSRDRPGRQRRRSTRPRASTQPRRTTWSATGTGCARRRST